MRSSDRGRRIHRVAVAVARVLDGRPLRAGRAAGVFVHVPRTSGTSLIGDFGIERLSRPGDVTYFFDGRRRLVTFDHVPPHLLIAARLVPQDHFERAFVFGMVRDPYSWAVSVHGSAVRQGTIDPDTSVTTWLEAIRRIHAADRAAHPAPAVLGAPEADWMERQFSNWLNLAYAKRAWPQHTYFDGVRVDLVGRFEDIAGSRAAIAAGLGVPLPEESHRWTGAGSRAGVVYDEQPRAAELVREIYAEDFRRFGYDPDRIPTAAVDA